MYYVVKRLVKEIVSSLCISFNYLEQRFRATFDRKMLVICCYYYCHMLAVFVAQCLKQCNIKPSYQGNIKLNVKFVTECYWRYV